LYNYEPPKWKDLAIVKTKLPTIINHLEETQKVVQALKENLKIARNCMKQQADRNRTETEFEVGEWVFVKIQPYNKLSLKHKGKTKSTPRFYGQYQINKKISQVAYSLSLPNKVMFTTFSMYLALKKHLENTNQHKQHFRL